MMGEATALGRLFNSPFYDLNNCSESNGLAMVEALMAVKPVV